MIVRITHLDGRLPNLALMRLSAWHKARGDQVVFSRSSRPSMFEPRYDRVYASAVFTSSRPAIADLRRHFPHAIVGGTGSGEMSVTVEGVLGEPASDLDYGLYPDFDLALGFTSRGCRFDCAFCVVPEKEGRPRSAATIGDIRRLGRKRKLILLDNDFFGQPRDAWRARIAEMNEGRFQPCFVQGINLRHLTEEQAAALASVEYRALGSGRVLYTAWDNLTDEWSFFRGVDRLSVAGVPATHLRSYMLVGFDPAETMDAIMHRLRRMTDRGIEPYPMVHSIAAERDPAWHRTLKRFQRWVNRGLYRDSPFTDYTTRRRPPKRERERQIEMTLAAMPTRVVAP